MKKLTKTLGLSALLILLGAVLAYALARAGLEELDQAAREELGGLYLETPRGVLSYTREGPLDARPIILFAGATVGFIILCTLLPIFRLIKAVKS